MALYEEPHKPKAKTSNCCYYFLIYSTKKTYKTTYFVGFYAIACHHILEYYFLLFCFVFLLCFMVSECVTKWLRQAVARYGGFISLLDGICTYIFHAFGCKGRLILSLLGCPTIWVEWMIIIPKLWPLNPTCSSTCHT